MDPFIGDDTKAQQLLHSLRSKIMETHQDGLSNSNLEQLEILDELEKLIKKQDQQNLARSKKSVEDQVFQNPLLVSMILNYSRVADVLQLRRVNFLWFKFCNKSLLDHQDVKIEFTLSQEFRQYFKGHSLQRQEDSCIQDYDKSLKNFMILLENNSKLWPHPKSTYSLKENFPCSSFTFSSFALYKVYDVQEFFTNFGFLIRLFKFDMSFPLDDNKDDQHCMTKKKLFENLFRIKLPRLEELHIGSLPYSWESFKDKRKIFSKFPPLQLDTMKKLQYECHTQGTYPRLQEFLVAFPKLEYFDVKHNSSEYIPAHSLDCFISANRIDLIKSLTFDPYHDLDLYDQFSNQQGISLEIIKLRFEPRSDDMDPIKLQKYSQILSRILKSSRESLKSLSLFLSIGTLPNIDWPILAQVTSLHVLSDDYGEVKHSLKNNLVLDNVFPNLTDIYLSGSDLYEHSPNFKVYVEMFPFGTEFPESNGFLPNLRKLHFTKSWCTIKWIKKFRRMFPNISHLTVRINQKGILKEIWKWSTIQILDLIIKADDKILEKKFSLLDLQFTGLSVEECGRLLKTSVGKGTCGLQIQSPLKNSIRQLNKLKKLSIYFKVSHWNSELEHKFHFLVSAPITGNMTLSKMEDLMEVKFKSNMRNENLVHECVITKLEERMMNLWKSFRFKVNVNL